MSWNKGTLKDPIGWELGRLCVKLNDSRKAEDAQR